jgi:probable biosynthetic protein (TIGR04098 family)
VTAPAARPDAAPDWNVYDLIVQMPHMAPGEKLSEVEFLKIIAACQWESIARALGRRPPAIVNEANERLYGSVIDVELCLSERHSMEILGEDASVRIANRVRFYAQKFVEGLFVIDDRDIPRELLAGIATRKDLTASGASYACMTNAFIARSGGNVKLKVFRPAGADEARVPQLGETPYGIVEQGRVQASGELEPLGAESAGIPLEPRKTGLIPYSIVPESDLNGAGLVYFARFEAMMNYGERLFLCENLALPTSTDFVSFLSTDHRRALFFANASPSDTVLVDVSAQVLPPGTFRAAALGGAYRVPLKLLFRIDLYRSSDNVLMASSLVRKSLNVPAGNKAVLAECERLLRRVTGGR